MELPSQCFELSISSSGSISVVNACRALHVDNTVSALGAMHSINNSSSIVSHGFQGKLLHCNSCVTVLTGQKAALQYARQHFSKFATSHMADIQRVMGALCFARRAGTTPYTDLSSPTQWDDVAREFARQCCGLLGQVRALCADVQAAAVDALVQAAALDALQYLLQSQTGSAFACTPLLADRLLFM